MWNKLDQPVLSLWQNPATKPRPADPRSSGEFYSQYTTLAEKENKRRVSCKIHNLSARPCEETKPINGSGEQQNCYLKTIRVYIAVKRNNNQNFVSRGQQFSKQTSEQKHVTL